VQLGLHQLVEPELDAYVAESRRFYADRRAAARNRATFDPRTVDGLRAARQQRSASTLPPGRCARECVAEAGGRTAPVRLIRPASGTVRGVYLDIHAGGFFMESAARNDGRNVRLADALGVAVVSVDYRLAPENPWPAAPDDCETAALWLLGQADRLFGTDILVLGGASAGANLAMVTLMRLRARGALDRVAGAVLQFGAYDLSGQSPGGRRYADEWFIDAYAGQIPDRSIPDISPLYGDPGGLPPTLMVVGALDILLEDNLAMAARILAAGGSVDVRVYPESQHAFTFHPTGMAAAAWHGIQRWIDGRLSGA
jgi:acetyl esterase